MTSRDFFWAILELLGALFLLIPVSIEVFHLRKIAVHDRILTELLLSTMAMLGFGAISRFSLGNPALKWLIYLTIALTYASMLACVSIYTEYVLFLIRKRANVSSGFRYAVHGICITLSIVNIVLMPTGLVCLVDPQTARPIFGTLFTVLLFLITVPMFADVAMLQYYRKILGSRNTVVFTLCLLLPIAALPLALVWNTVLSQLILTLSVLLIYAVVHSNQNAEAADQKKVLTADQEKLVFSQMQPHFMFNALDTIYYLCGAEPETAKTAISDFSDFLRINLNAPEFQEPVPFSTELQHTEKYLSLEKLRFEERLQIVWDIQTTDFCLPVLSVQPLVENAVKHGVNKRKEGGTVTIRTERNRNGFVITVADNGVGFDTEKEIVDTEDRAHIGIAGVRRCLHLMSGGTLDISSTPGVGTTAVIQLPKAAAIQKERERNG